MILTPAAPNQVEVKIVWVSGHYSLIPLLRAYQRWEDVPTYPAMLQRIRQLWEQGLNDQSIADQLHQEGFPAFYEGARLSRHNISDLENLPFFLAAGFLYVLTQPPLLLAQVLLYGYVVSRLLHFAAYLTARTHDTRATLWTIGSLILIFMTVRTLLAALGW